MDDPVDFLKRLFRAAVDEASPRLCVPRFLPPPPRGRTVVVGAGKAAAAMAAAVEQAWEGPLEGLVVTRYGHKAQTHRIEVVEAAHPQPDLAGETAARRILDLVRGLGPDDLVLCLISGGGSSLLPLPPPGVALADKIALNRDLLRSGASIGEMNVVRKHVSLIKGGRLAVAAAPAPVVSLIVSDVPGDDISAIASGPTAPDGSTREQALSILKRYRISAPREISAWLNSAESETPKPGHPAFHSVKNLLVATPQSSLEAAAKLAREAGVEPIILGDAIEGEAREVGKVMAGIGLSANRWGAPLRPPCVILSGGETSVTLRGTGRGGRNAEFALALALALDAAPRIWAFAGDTDGIDGSEDNAGAFVTPDTLPRARNLGLSPRSALDNNDAYGFFKALGNLVTTGPTLTNVNDFRAIVVL